MFSAGRKNFAEFVGRLHRGRRHAGANRAKRGELSGAVFENRFAEQLNSKAATLKVFTET
jgi:hypothetical protein